MRIMGSDFLRPFGPFLVLDFSPMSDVGSHWEGLGRGVIMI